MTAHSCGRGRTDTRPSWRRSGQLGVLARGGGRGDRLAGRDPRRARSRARARAAARGRRARAPAARGRARAGRAPRPPRRAPCARARARWSTVWRVAVATPRRELAPSSRACWCRRARWRATWSAGARESRASVRARSTIASRERCSSRAASPRSAARASAQLTGTAASAAWVGVEQAIAATSSISVRSVWWPTDEMTGTRSSATVRHSVSSQNANRSASDPPPRATTITSTSSHAARSCSARVMAGAAWRSCTGANAHTIRPAQPRRRSPASTSSRALPPSPETTPMTRGSDGRGSRFCGSNRPSAASVLAQPLDLGEQVALAGHPELRDREGERRRRRPRAGVEVAAAGGDDDRAVAERLEPERLPVLAPHRARQRARAVAQLEPHLRPARASARTPRRTPARA